MKGRQHVAPDVLVPNAEIYEQARENTPTSVRNQVQGPGRQGELPL